MKPAAPDATDGIHQTSAGRESTGQKSDAIDSEDQRDHDLQRADQLVSLHYDVKLKYQDTGPDPEFVQAGKDVDNVIRALNRSR